MRTLLERRHGSQRWLPYGRPALIGALLGVSSLVWVCCARGVDETPGGDPDPLLDASVQDAADGAAGGGAGGGGGGADAASGRCDLNLAFGTPSLVPNVNSAVEEYGARLSQDELTMYIATDRPHGAGDIDVYVATRSSLDAEFDEPQPLPSVNSTYRDINPSVTGDGLTLYLQSTRPGGLGSGDIFVATRSTVVAEFGSPEAVAVVNDTSDDGDPYILSAGETLYLTSARGGSYDIYRAARGGNGSFGEPTEVTEVSSSDDDVLPVVSEDDQTMFFASDRTSGGALGEMDIWVAVREGSGSPFGAPANMVPLNSSAGDRPTWLSADGCVLYLVSERPGSSGGRDIWVARRP